LLSERLKNFKGKVWWLPLKKKYEDKRNSIAEWAIQEIAKGKGYDYKSLFKQILGRVSIETGKYFCSEFVHASLVFGASIALPMKAARPGDLENLGVYEKRILIYDNIGES